VFEQAQLRCSVLGVSKRAWAMAGSFQWLMYVWVDDEELLGRHDESFVDLQGHHVRVLFCM
jgi:hypothetical protein